MVLILHNELSVPEHLTDISAILFTTAEQQGGSHRLDYPESSRGNIGLIRWRKGQHHFKTLSYSLTRQVLLNYRHSSSLTLETLCSRS